MQFQNIWPILFTSGIFMLLYIFFLNNFTKASVINKLTLSGSEEERSTLRKALSTPNWILAPIKEKLLSLTPRNIIKNLEKMLSLAGSKWQTGDLLLLKIILGISLLMLAAFTAQKLPNVTVRLAMAIAFPVSGLILPDFILKRRAKSRLKSIHRTLPSFIDYLTICVEAGLGLDISILRVVGQLHGPLAEEFANTITEIKYGKAKRDAFKNLSAKLNIPELTSFLNAILVGEQLGIGLSGILRIQGQQIREKRRQKVREDAYKVPVKLTFPLVLFILPGLFVVLLGPAVIQVFNTLF